MRARAWLAAILLSAAAACGNPLARQYEYDEQLYLSVDGAATVVVNASLPALAALRGAAIDTRRDGGETRESIRRLYEAGGCAIDRVSRFWTRQGRRFVQIRISVENVAALSRCALLTWSTYALTPEGDHLRYRQTVGPPAGGEPGSPGWTGRELVAFKLHAPSRVTYQNVKTLDGANGRVERGNILTWEQRLTDRLAGRPVEMDVVMESTSILYTTIWIFLGAAAAAVATLAGAIWWMLRKGRRPAEAARASGPHPPA